MMEAAINIGANTYSIGMCPAVHITGNAGYHTNFKYHTTDTYQSSTNKPLVFTDGYLPLYMGNAANPLAVNIRGERFLNEALGMNAGVLENTVKTYNKACQAGKDNAFGKDAKYLDSVGNGPYYAIVMRNCCYCTCGGLDIDADLRVLDTKGNVINGPYAVGMDSSGVLFFERAPYVMYGGACQGWACTSGRLAGEIAAKAGALINLTP